MVLTLQSTTFLFCVIIYHFRLLVVCMFPSGFDPQEHVLHVRTFKGRVELMLHGCNESRLGSSFRRFCGRYDDLVCDYGLLLARVLGGLFYTFC
jgi:hypothetical protein